MRSPQRSLGPEAFHVVGEMKLVKRPNVDEIGVFARDLISVLVFLDRLVLARPFTQPADGVLVKSLQDVLSRKAGADDDQHHLFASVERISPVRQAGDAAVAAPVLTHSAEIRESTWQMRLLEVRLFLVAPDDVPLRVAEIGVVLRAGIILNIGGRGFSFDGLCNWRMYL